MTGSFVAQSVPADRDRLGDVELQVGQKVRFLVSMPDDDIDIGDVGKVWLVYRTDDTSVFIETHPGAGCIVLEDYELWKIETIQ